jgi:hypothetical protein
MVLAERRIWVVVVATSLLLVGAVVSGWLVLQSGGRQGAPRSAAGPTQNAYGVHTGDEPGEATNVAAVTRLLTGLPEAFAAGRRDGLTSAAATRMTDLGKALPPGTSLSVDARSWRRTGAVASIKVRVTTPGAAAQQLLVVVILDNGDWRVSQTFTLAGPS